MKQKGQNVSIARTARQYEYAHPKVNFQRIAALWGAYLETRGCGPINPDDVANMMMLLKISREMHAHKEDNLIDIEGYCETKRMLRE